jgi:hypothetical protein
MSLGGFLVLIACCIFGFKLTSQTSELASNMAGGGGSAIGSKIGGLAASAAKSVGMAGKDLGQGLFNATAAKPLRKARDNFKKAVGQKLGIGRYSGKASGKGEGSGGSGSGGANNSVPKAPSTAPTTPTTTTPTNPTTSSTANTSTGKPEDKDNNENPQTNSGAPENNNKNGTEQSGGGNETSASAASGGRIKGDNPDAHLSPEQQAVAAGHRQDFRATQADANAAAEQDKFRQIAEDALGKAQAFAAQSAKSQGVAKSKRGDADKIENDAKKSGTPLSVKDQKTVRRLREEAKAADESADKNRELGKEQVGIHNQNNAKANDIGLQREVKEDNYVSENIGTPVGHAMEQPTPPTGGGTPTGGGAPTGGGTPTSRRSGGGGTSGGGRSDAQYQQMAHDSLTHGMGTDATKHLGEEAVKKYGQEIKEAEQIGTSNTKVEGKGYHFHTEINGDIRNGGYVDESNNGRDANVLNNVNREELSEKDKALYDSFDKDNGAQFLRQKHEEHVEKMRGSAPEEQGGGGSTEAINTASYKDMTYDEVVGKAREDYLSTEGGQQLNSEVQQYKEASEANMQQANDLEPQIQQMRELRDEAVANIGDPTAKDPDTEARVEEAKKREAELMEIIQKHNELKNAATEARKQYNTANNEMLKSQTDYSNKVAKAVKDSGNMKPVS